VARIAASIYTEGQKTPVLLVAGGTLVDGYHRVAAVRSLALDQVAAIELAVDESEALILSWKLETGRRKSALEEAWLLAELLNHGESITSLARRLHRPKSWVSQRLGLARALPEAVQNAVRDCRIAPQAAMKYLLPMARVNPDGCVAMVSALPESSSVRQVERLYTTWRRADPEVRHRIEQNPALFLKTEDAMDPSRSETGERLVQAMEALSRSCHLSRKLVAEGLFARANKCQLAWQQVEAAFVSLREEVAHAQC
jgi:hypothetical protein